MSCTTTTCTPIAKRMCLATFLGLGFGILYFYGFSTQEFGSAIHPFQEWSAANDMMWYIILSQVVLGFVIGLMGFVTVHPLFGFRLPPFLRGLVIGAFVSLPMAFNTVMGNPNGDSMFWCVLIIGGIIGMITDIIVTLSAGQGNDLYTK